MEYALRETELTKNDEKRLYNAKKTVRNNLWATFWGTAAVAVLYTGAQFFTPDSTREKLKETFKDEAAAIVVGVAITAIGLGRDIPRRRKLNEIKEYQRNYLGLEIAWPVGPQEIAAAYAKKAERLARRNARMTYHREKGLNEIENFALGLVAKP